MRICALSDISWILFEAEHSKGWVKACVSGWESCRMLGKKGMNLNSNTLVGASVYTDR